MRNRATESIMVAALLLFGTCGVSAEQSERSGWWVGLDVGVGRVERVRFLGGSADVDTNLYLGFKAGYAVHNQVLVGVELSGWNQEATDRDDPSKGEGLMQAFVISRLYPAPDTNLFAKVGGGWVRQWVKGTNGKTARDGWGGTVGIGYDVPLGRGWSLTPFFNYGFSFIGDRTNQAFTLGTGFTFF